MTSGLGHEAELLRAVAGVLPDQAFVLDEDGHYEEVLTGEEELLYKKGLTMHEVLPQETADLCVDLIRRTIDSGRSQTLEYAVRFKSGETLWFEGKTSLMDRRSDSGKRMVVWAARDITERKRESEDRARLQAQLLQAQKLETIGTLAGGIAHDFNNVLTPLIGFTDLALQDVDDSDRVRSNLQHVLKAALRARQLVQQILTFSRQVEQERQPVEVPDVANEALDLLRSSLPATIEIRRDLDSACRTVLADGSQLQQVLMNLCTNSFHAMRDAGGILEVTVREVEADRSFREAHPRFKDDRYVKIRVRDNGHGMDRETLARVREPFFTTKPAGEGSGLGLSVVHGIVESHAGEMVIRSRPGVGTVVDVYLPCHDEALESVSVAEPPIPRGTERILFVDDEEEIALMGKEMLDRLGYEVEIRTSSTDALHRFREIPSHFDLVVTDQTMPGLTGTRLAAELLAIRPDLPIILMTGFSAAVTPESVSRLGIRAYVMKPVIVRDLAIAVRQSLDGHG